MTGIDPGAAATLLFLGVGMGVELTRIAIDWNHDPRTGGNMRHLTALIITIALAGGLVAAAASSATCDPDTERVFADVPADHLFCAEIEELWRRGSTSGCGDGNYCPGDAFTRAQAAAFALQSSRQQQSADDPFARVSSSGDLVIGSGVVDVERVAVGTYLVTFDRPADNCVYSVQPHENPHAWMSAHPSGSPELEDSMYVFAWSPTGAPPESPTPLDASFDLVARCISITGDVIPWAMHTSPDAD